MKLKQRKIPAMTYSPTKRICSTIGAGGLNFCVRNGNRCDPSAITTRNLWNLSKEKSRQWPTLPQKEYAVPSALEDLTSVFGMDTGVTPPPLSPGFSFYFIQELFSSLKTATMYNFLISFLFHLKLFQPSLLSFSLGQALDLLVSVSSIDHSTYTPDLSTRSSFWCLTSL